MTAAAEVVRAWHAALNAGDVERLLSLSQPDVEVGGPRGSGRGADVLRDWVARAGVRLQPARVFARGDVVVVEQSARWPSEPGAEPGESQMVASLFRVRDGRVASVIRHADLAAAIEAAGVDAADEA